jgi:hypothetical protein
MISRGNHWSYVEVGSGSEREDPKVKLPSSGKSTVSSRASESGECASDTTSIGCVSTTRGMTAVPASNSTQSLPDSTSLPYPRGGTLACRPPQRQLNVQLQASSSHSRDINALVEDMIASNPQCVLHNSTSKPYVPSPLLSGAGRKEPFVDTTEYRFQGENTPDEDEGFSEIADEDWGTEEELTLQKARTSSGIQKYGVMRWRGGAFVKGDRNAGRLKVRTGPILGKISKLGSRYTCLNCKKARAIVSIRVFIT